MKTIRQRKSWKFNSNDINVWDNFFTEEIEFYMENILIKNMIVIMLLITLKMKTI